jgi:hypothetical protein
VVSFKLVEFDFIFRGAPSPRKIRVDLQARIYGLRVVFYYLTLLNMAQRSAKPQPKPREYVF